MLATRQFSRAWIFLDQPTRRVCCCAADVTDRQKYETDTKQAGQTDRQRRQTINVFVV